MTTSYQVETGDVAISDALLGIAEGNRWHISHGMTKPYRHYLWLVLYPDDLHVDWNNGPHKGYKTTTIPEFVVLLREGSPVVIDGWPVEFKTNGILVANKFIPINIIDAIHARLHRR